MPYIITKKNGKPYKLPGKPTVRDIPVWSRDDVGSFSRDGKANGDCWTLTNVVTRRSIHVGACKRETPGDLWGARGRRRRGRGFRDAAPPAAPSASAPIAQKPAAPAMAGFFDKIFGKKPPKRNPMSRRIYMIKTKSGTYIPAGVASMQGARRRRKRRRR